MMKGQGIDRAEIKLNPPHLGPLEIRVAVTQEQTSLLMSSQHALTRDALEQALPRLREMLQDKGLEMGDAEVSDGREEQLAQEEKGDEQAGERDGGTGPGSSASKAGVETAVLREGQVSLLDEYV
nr:flagellar hook-length control protein FliK [Natronospira proteinivora]